MKSFSYKLKAFYWPLVDAIVVHFDTWLDIFHFGFVGRILVLIGQIPGHCLVFFFLTLVSKGFPMIYTVKKQSSFEMMF